MKRSRKCGRSEGSRERSRKAAKPPRKGFGGDAARLAFAQGPETPAFLSWRLGLTIVSIDVEVSELTQEVSSCWRHEDGNGAFVGA